METINRQICINNIKSIYDEINELNKKLIDSKDNNNIIDISGKIIESLRSLVAFINENSELRKNRLIKNETTLLKDYFICYINGISNNNDYIISKYKNYIHVEYNSWEIKIKEGMSELEEIDNDMNIYINIEKSLKNINTMFKYIQNNSIEDIIVELSNRYNISPVQLANMPMGGYGKEHTSGAYYFTLKDMKENYKEYLWLYNQLEDDESKEVLTNLCRFRMTVAIQFIREVFDNSPQYFEKNIVKCTEDEVFVDCGGFVGDTAESYIECYTKYKKIYVYEPSSENVKTCLKNTSKYENIIVRQAGVGVETGKFSFSKEGAASSFINGSGEKEIVEIISLDHDIEEIITFLKMDIEGEEINALKGARDHIINDKPKLAICVYHIISDLWEIPKLIYSMNLEYKLYLRHYREDQAWETVVYAIP